MEFIRHESGAHILFLPSKDANKVFSVNFATPPSDDSGAAHAVEHCVLRGSRAYPVDDPFGALSAGYLNTYLNAITYPERTVYPAASLFDGAFYQMLDVYLDAAFNPLLNLGAFRQEVYDARAGKGIIHSEMAAFFSDPAEVLKREAGKRLFRGTCYEYCAAGAPEGVARLTYEDFKGFYGRFYDPGNCFIYLYGNLDFGRAMSAIEPYLGDYERRNTAYFPQNQSHSMDFRFAGISETRATPELKEPCAGVFFRVCPVTDIFSLGMLEILKIYLTKSRPSEFMEFLHERLGSRPEFCVNADGRDAVFSVIFRDCAVSPEMAREAVLSAFGRAVERMDVEALEAAASEYCFSVIEAKTGYKPRGLVYGLKMYQNWLYGGNLTDCLKAATTAARLVETPPGEYAEYVKRRLIGNEGIVSLALIPGEAPVRSFAFPEARAEMENASPAGTGGSSFSFPDMRVARAEVKPDFVPAERTLINGIPVLRHCLDTNGLAYMSAYFSLASMPPRIVRATAIAARVLVKLRAGNKGARDTGLFLRKNFGDFKCAVDVYDIEEKGQGAGNGDFAAFFSIRAKMRKSSAPMFFDAVKMLLETAYFDYSGISRSRDESLESLNDFKALLSEALAEAELSMKKPEAAARRSRAMFMRSAAFDEEANGEGLVRSLKEILSDFDERAPALIQSLEELLSALPENLEMVSVAGIKPDEAVIPDFYSRAAKSAARGDAMISRYENAAIKGVSNLAQSFPMESGCDEADGRLGLLTKPDFRAANSRPYGDNGGFQPFVGAAISRPHSNPPFVNRSRLLTARCRGEMSVLACAIKDNFLMSEVRLKGGSYGIDCEITPRRATIQSFSDPDPAGALDAFLRIPDYISNISAEEVKRASVAALNSYLRPLHAEERIMKSLERFLLQIDEKNVNNEIDGIFSAGPDKLKKYADIFENGLEKGFYAVISL